MSRRLMLLTVACVSVGAITFAPVVRGSPIHVNLVPDNPGPYFGGEQLTVDVWLESHFESDVLLRLMQFDFAASDSALNLAPVFEFDFDHSDVLVLSEWYGPFTTPDLPAPFTGMLFDCICLSSFLSISSQDVLHIGSVDIELPTDLGIYGLDMLNPNEQEFLQNESGSVISLFPDIPLYANTGEIVGGTYDFIIVPEPTTYLLTGLAALALVLGRRRRSSGNTLVILLSVLSFAHYVPEASARPSPNAANSVSLNYDSGNWTASGGGEDAVEVFSDMIDIPTSPACLQCVCIFSTPPYPRAPTAPRRPLFG